MRYLAIVGFVFAVVLSGCATTEQLQPTGGSRSDGTIDMSYEYTMFQKPQPNWSDAQQKAQERCEAWGYNDAEKFGGQTSTCEQNGSMGCQKTLVTAKYQCTN
ncbi:YecR family lipoprotein [Salinisphaera hydrothermalis]|uniref:YecR family lipoprotein n=1 Tax=Salinisphaera hydrothermalis TaxID=563188 RepID=UPI00333F1DC7